MRERACWKIKLCSPPPIGKPAGRMAFEFTFLGTGTSQGARQISTDEIIQSDPDFIGLICCGYDLIQNKLFAKQVYDDKRINHLTAIKDEKIYAFDSDSYFSRPSLRILEGAMHLRNAIIKKDNQYHCKRDI